jgi:hypothetical protein
MPARMIDQQPAHDLGSYPKKMRAILPVNPRLIDQA